MIPSIGTLLTSEGRRHGYERGALAFLSHSASCLPAKPACLPNLIRYLYYVQVGKKNGTVLAPDRLVEKQPKAKQERPAPLGPASGPRLPHVDSPLTPSLLQNQRALEASSPLSKHQGPIVSRPSRATHDSWPVSCICSSTSRLLLDLASILDQLRDQANLLLSSSLVNCLPRRT